MCRESASLFAEFEVLSAGYGEWVGCVVQPADSKFAACPSNLHLSLRHFNPKMPGRAPFSLRLNGFS
jgi:hypothetical protein